MWRANFYEKNKYGGGIYKVLVSTLWIVLLLGAGYNHMTTGQPQPWALPILLAGFVLFSIAKISMFRQGKWFTFGADTTAGMSGRMAACYLIGYLLMIVGFILSFA